MVREADGVEGGKVFRVEEEVAEGVAKVVQRSAAGEGGGRGYAAEPNGSRREG